MGPSKDIVLLEEFDREGLGWLADETSRLSSAVSLFGESDDNGILLRSMVSGQFTCWMQCVQAARLGPYCPGVDAKRDGDDYILNGFGEYTGIWPKPDYVLALASLRWDERSDSNMAAFLIPRGLRGMTTYTPRRLSPGGFHQIGFQQVRVPSLNLLNSQLDRNEVGNALTLAFPIPLPPPRLDQHVAELLECSLNTTIQGTVIYHDKIRQQLLMEAYINSRLQRLFRIRDTWMHANRNGISYHRAQTRLMEQQMAWRLSEITRSVLGPYALLDKMDIWALNSGNQEVQQRKLLSLAEQADDITEYKEVISQALGLGE